MANQTMNHDATHCAEKFKHHLESAMNKMHLIGGVKGVDVGAVIKALEAQPTADVVPRRILFDLERKLHSMLPFKAHSILTYDKYMANSYEMGQERVIYDILNYLAELEKNTRKENGDG